MCVCVCLCVCVSLCQAAVDNPLQGFLGPCHDFSWVFLPLFCPGQHPLSGRRRESTTLAPHSERPSLIPSEKAGWAWAPCRDILGRDSNNPGANYPWPQMLPSISLFFKILFFISVLLLVSLFNSSPQLLLLL